ncbi:MAG: hypothetical protein H6Q74_356 [Firmicutes bacterium]|nr:hypothetical protein [Bacillota bacterium]
MKKSFFVGIIALFAVQNSVFASSVSGTFSDTYSKQTGTAVSIIPDITVNWGFDITKNISFFSSFESVRTIGQPAFNVMNASYFKYVHGGNKYILGKQGVTLSNGLVASMSGVNGIKADVQTAGNQLATFYGENNNKKVVAFDFKKNKITCRKDLNLEAVYLRVTKRYVGLTVSDKIDSKLFLTVETSKNLDTKATGYLITTTYGALKKNGDADITLSFRNVENGAVSEYCTDGNYNNSIGFRIGTDYKMSTSSTLIVYQDIVRSQSNVNMDKTLFEIVMNF